MEVDYKKLFEELTSRYKGSDPFALMNVLCPLLIPIKALDKNIFKVLGQGHYRATFTIEINEENEELMMIGRTGKFVSQQYVTGNGPWNEIAKGRIIEVDIPGKIAYGEVYVGGHKDELIQVLEVLTEQDFLEIDQYGAAAKILSGLVENALSRIAKQSGYKVKRMPEDMARHLGDYYHYDFAFEKNGINKKIEVKSLWGTNTKYARLIHSKTNDYLTSSCKFETQDIFAVSLFLRTGNINDFAFARSVSKEKKSYGLPTATNFSEYVHQNPVCEVGDGVWFSTIDEAWDLE